MFFRCLITDYIQRCHKGGVHTVLLLKFNYELSLIIFFNYNRSSSKNNCRAVFENKNTIGCSMRRKG